MASPLLEVTPVTLSTGLTTYYTVSANKTCNIIYIVLCNNTANSCNALVHFVPAGGSNNSSTVIYNDSIPAHRTATLDFTIARGTNSTVQASASANSSISMAISPMEVA